MDRHKTHFAPLHEFKKGAWNDPIEVICQAKSPQIITKAQERVNCKKCLKQLGRADLLKTAHKIKNLKAKTKKTKI